MIKDTFPAIFDGPQEMILPRSPFDANVAGTP
jgi:hypothetical protein